MAIQPITYILVCYKNEDQGGHRVGDMTEAIRFEMGNAYGYPWYNRDGSRVYNEGEWREATSLEEDLYYMGHKKLKDPNL